MLTLKAWSRKIGRKLKTRVSLFLLVFLAMPAAASRDNDLNFTSAVPITTLDTKYCLNNAVLPAENTRNHRTHDNMPSKSRKPTKGFVANRKSGIKILKKVQVQLQLARNNFRYNRELVNKLYKDVHTVMRTDYHYEWLPSMPLIWYEEHVKNLDKDTKIRILLPVLRDSLVNFSVTLDQMRQFSERKYMSNYPAIKRILDELFINLIAVLCEVESALQSAGMWYHEWRVPHGAKAVIIGGGGWNANPDHTAILLQDWGVLTKYYQFLKDWLFISKDMVKYQRNAKLNLTSSTVTKRGSRSSSSLPRLPCTRHRCKSSRRGRGSTPDTFT